MMIARRHPETINQDEVSMAEPVGGDLRDGDLILTKKFDYNGKLWRSFLLVPEGQTNCSEAAAFGADDGPGPIDALV
jgi:hypothetical protein